MSLPALRPGRPTLAGAVFAGLVLVLLASVAGGGQRAEGVEPGSQVTARFAVARCEGPDGIPGNADDRPMNNPTAGGTAGFTYDMAAGTWHLRVSLTNVRAGEYRLRMGDATSGAGVTLHTFAVVDDSPDRDDHVDVAFTVPGVASAEQYDVLEVERRGPPWGGGGACTGDQAGHDGSGDGGGEPGECEDEEGETCPGGDEGEPGECENDEGEACPGGDDGAHEPGGCEGGHEPGSRWRAELVARYSLGPSLPPGETLDLVPEPRRLWIDDEVSLLGRDVLRWSSADGSLGIELPAAAVAPCGRVGLTFEEGRVEDEVLREGARLVDGRPAIGGRAFILTLTDLDTEERVARLRGHLRVSMPIDADEADRRGLAAMRWDAEDGRWIELPTRWDDGRLAFESDHSGLFAVFELPVRTLDLYPGRNPVVFSGADGTRAGDLAERASAPVEGIRRLVSVGATTVPLAADDRLTKGEALVIDVSAPATVGMTAWTAEVTAMRPLFLGPGTHALVVSAPSSTDIVALLGEAAPAVASAYRFDARTGAWERWLPGAPGWTSAPFEVAPFDVVWVRVRTGTVLAVPDALLGRAVGE